MALFKKFEYRKSKSTPREEFLLDIVENLNNVLNTKREYGSILNDFGIRDLSDHYSRDVLTKAIVAEVKYCIGKYEPRVRLTGVEQMEDENPFRLAFRINCVLKDSAQTLQMIFDSFYNTFSVNQD